MRTPELHARVSDGLAQSFYLPASKPKDLLILPKTKHGDFVGESIIGGPKAAFAWAYAVQ